MRIELTETGFAGWIEWFQQHARDGVREPETRYNMLDIMESRLDAGETLMYELNARYTHAGRPEIFTLRAGDYVVTPAE